MALKTLKSKIKYRISRSADMVFTPKEFLDLSDQDQVGRALRQLIEEEFLIRIGYGLYARAVKSPYSGKLVPERPLPELAESALSKLGVRVVPSKAMQRYNSGKSMQVPTGRVIGVKGRVRRKISFDGKSVKIEHVAG
jgi:hypothetical protein